MGKPKERKESVVKKDDCGCLRPIRSGMMGTVTGDGRFCPVVWIDRYGKLHGWPYRKPAFDEG